MPPGEMDVAYACRRRRRIQTIPPVPRTRTISMTMPTMFYPFFVVFLHPDALLRMQDGMSLQRVQAYPPTRGAFSMSARCFLPRSISRNHGGTDVPGISVIVKFPSFHPCTSVQVGRVSPPPQVWYCSTDLSMFSSLPGSLIYIQGNQYPRERADVALPRTQRPLRFRQ